MVFRGEGLTFKIKFYIKFENLYQSNFKISEI